MFIRNNLDAFIRVMIFNNHVTLCHIKNGRLLHVAELSDMGAVFAYLNENAATPVEVVVHDDAMVCRLIPITNLRRRDVKALATNLLAERDEANTCLYEELTRNNYGNITVCSMMMDTEVLSFLRELLAARNLILSVSCWPLWIARHCCDLYKSDVSKFAALLLIGEHDESWEMVIVRNGNCVCYRSGDINSFNQTAEIEDTLRYINNVMGISPNDVVIYTVTKEAILGITNTSSACMSVVSKNAEINIARYSRITDRVIRLGCYFITLMAFICSVVNVSEALSYQRKLTEAHKIVASIDQKIVDETCLWQSLGDIQYGNIVNFKEILLKHVPGSKILRNASVTVGANADDVKVNIILET
jgi:hypothetical protein